MKLDKKQFSAIAQKIVSFLKQYAVLIFILLGLGIFGFLVFRINILSNQEPTDEMVTEKLGQKKPIFINESDVKKVQELQSNNIEVKSLFEQSRDNPFQE